MRGINSAAETHISGGERNVLFGEDLRAEVRFLALLKIDISEYFIMDTEDESKLPFLDVVERDAYPIDHLASHIPATRRHRPSPPPYAPQGGNPHHQQSQKQQQLRRQDHDWG